MSKTIPLTQGYEAIIDDDDYPLISQYKWHALSIQGGKFVYARTWDGHANIFMHNLILGEKYVDHIDSNTVDNRRCNIRPATQSQNNANRRKSPNKSSRYKGVVWDRGKWKAQIQKDGRKYALGRFDDEEEAARAYDEAALEIFGEFARVNFPDD